MAFHKLAIQDINKETAAAVTISFDVPSSLKEKFSFKAGQYITLKTEIDGKDIRRDYSICTSPKSGTLTVAVKAIENGLFSKYANTTLKVGDVLEVAEPNGRFVFEADASKTRTVAAFAAGSGITPIMSIAKTILEDEPNSHFILIYGNKTPKDTIFFNALLALHSKYTERFSIQMIFSQSQEENAMFGRIERSTVNFLLKNTYKNNKIDTFYLCGPEGMITTTKDVLKDFGVAESDIHFELFTAPVTSENTANTTVVNDGSTIIKIIVDDEETEFVMSQKQSILEAAIAKQIDAPYSCQGGICSSCIARVTEGAATMTQNNILTDSELAEGLVLTCQAHPTTPSIVVDYDDV
ncbi:ferredoxin--NADP reductase [Formosa sediminum]|uniref:Ferredoxin--NADP reductase n=1 Tax=Formosa sediminum TaxID=2594004 RepID=A0A516GNN3_9FLAO|nr:ferredoxin--NADP reductase [Formosa sediminum]QDO93136.1 ferredoxin--NADP reductase [Formosa sediminum]